MVLGITYAIPSCLACVRQLENIFSAALDSFGHFQDKTKRRLTASELKLPQMLLFLGEQVFSPLNVWLQPLHRCVERLI